MTSYQLLRAVYDDFPPKVLAEVLHLSLTMVQKWAEPPGPGQSGALSPLDRIQLMMSETKDPRIIRWLCQQADGFFVKNAKREERRQATFKIVNTLYAHFAETLREIARASADSRISGEEAVKIRAEWEQLKGWMEGFVQACERGDYRG